jgi:hypothetical protein
MGVDPFLQDTPFTDRVRLLTGSVGRVCTGYCGQGKQIQAGSVSSAIMAVGQTIALATNTNPTKIVGSEKLLPRLKQMLNGFRKADPLTTKQLPIIQLGLSPEAHELDCSIVLLPAMHWRVHHQGNSQQFKADNGIQNGRHHLLCQGQARKPSLPPSGCHSGPHCGSGWRHHEVGKLEEWVERSMCLSRRKWRPS